MSSRRLLALAATLATLGLVAILLALTWALRPHEPKRLEIGDAKPFGGFDPHLEIAVTQVEHFSDWGEGERRIEPTGAFYLVTVEAANTAAGDDFLVDPTALRVRIRDPLGQEWHPLDAPPHAGRAPGRSFRTEISSGETLHQEFLIDVPDDARAPVIWISKPSRFSKIFSGFEDSLLQEKLVVPLPHRRDTVVGR